MGPTPRVPHSARTAIDDRSVPGSDPRGRLRLLRSAHEYRRHPDSVDAEPPAIRQSNVTVDPGTPHEAPSLGSRCSPPTTPAYQTSHPRRSKLRSHRNS